jgi:quinol monooxygenase YgiN
MVARVTTVKVKPEDVEEAVRLFDESVLPAAEQEEGFMGALLLTREDGRALVIDLCDTVEHMRANERSGFYQAQVAKFADKIVERPAREFYDVAVAKGVEGSELLPRTE